MNKESKKNKQANRKTKEKKKDRIGRTLSMFVFILLFLPNKCRMIFFFLIIVLLFIFVKFPVLSCTLVIPLHYFFYLFLSQELTVLALTKDRFFSRGFALWGFFNVGNCWNVRWQAMLFCFVFPSI